MLRVEGGRLLATLIRLTGDIDLAEEAVQDALVVALERWPRDGMPDNPAAWITTTARRRALDRIRREAKRHQKEARSERLLDEPSDVDHEFTASAIRDDQLRLLFTCCHPALSPETRVALSLRTLCGLTTTEIARAFLVPEPTMGQRISRAKRKIATARIPYRVPEDHELPERLPGVLATIYVVFTMGHHPADGSLDARIDLADEAVRLARLLVDLMPDEPECAGLLALVLATHARRAARLDSSGNLVLMADQDRSRWDHESIASAARLVETSLRRRKPGPYQMQAAIATLHGLAPTFAETDWPQIAELYRLLERVQSTAVVRVNRAVAEAEVHGPLRGLALLEELSGGDRAFEDEDGTVMRWHLYWSTRADFLRRLGRGAEAVDAYRRALGCALNETDRRFLEDRLRSLSGSRMGSI